MATKYGTPAELRSHMGKTLTADDDVLEAILEAASRNIDRACKRPHGFIAVTVASARRYAGSGKPYQFIDECIAVTTVEVKASATDDDYDTWTTADWIACRGDPQYPIYDETPYDLLIVNPTGDESVFTSGAYTTRGGFRPLTDVTRGVPTVRITARWGYAATVPGDVKLACLMQSARWYKRFQSAMSDTLASGELGTLLFRQSLDPDVRRLLHDARYIKPTVGRR